MSNAPVLILLNGPRRCGKTEITKLVREMYGAMPRLCKDKLFELSMSMFSVKPEDFWRLYEDDDLKETPSPLFKITRDSFDKLTEIVGERDSNEGDLVEISVRESLIYVSELVCKPSFGKDYFGRARALDMKDDKIAIDDSTGFPEELPPAIDLCGQENILLIRIRGRGTYERDSRDFIPDGVINHTVDVWNTGTEEAYIEEMLAIIGNFLEPEQELRLSAMAQ